MVRDWVEIDAVTNLFSPRMWLNVLLMILHGLQVSLTQVAHLKFLISLMKFTHSTLIP
jgi:hypothetical protein